LTRLADGMIDAKLEDEAGRLAALDRYNVLDTGREQQFDKITALVRSILDVPIASVTLVAKDRQWFKSMNGLPILQTPRDISFCTHTILAREPLNIPDAQLDPRFCDNPLVTGDPFIRAYLGSPLMTPDGFNIGALCAIDSRPREFAASAELLMASFASLVVDELELRLIAEVDHLTGVLTRRNFIGRVSKQLSKAGLSHSTLVMFDVDHFKVINDRFGHPSGDKVLQLICSRVRAELPSGAAVGRLGGEEFGILLPDVDQHQAFRLIEQVRTAITELRLDFAPDLVVTASFGMVDLAGATVDHAVSEADAALYAAKRKGRNRTVLASHFKTAA